MPMVLNLSLIKGYDALNEYCLFLFSMERKGFSAIAHNAKGFDAVLIQRWLIENRLTADIESDSFRSEDNATFFDRLQN